MAGSLDVANQILYLLLFGCTIFVNKYVLSVLNFLYPTIFQGWQTLIGGILLKLLLTNKCINVTTTELDRAGFVSLLPSFLFFAAGVVASSKALAGLSVPLYLCLQNTLHASLYLLEATPALREGASPFTVLASLVTVASAIAAVLFEIDMTFADSPHFWMLMYLACLAVQTLHSKVADARYNEVDCLYFCYIFSVIVLAPASLYLHEAFEVLKFPNASRYDFYLGCLVSGVFGLFLNLTLMKVQCMNHFPAVDATGRLVMSVISLFTFSDRSSVIVRVFILMNLIAAILVPVPKKKSHQEKHSTLSEPLLSAEA